MSTNLTPSRRIIGPIPPRAKDGRLLAKDVSGKGLLYEANMEPVESAIKDLHVFEVDLPPEPLVRVYARNPEEALRLFQREMGLTRIGEVEPVIRRV